MKRLLASGLIVVLAAACGKSPVDVPPAPGLAVVPGMGIGQAFVAPVNATGVRVEGGSAGAEYTLIPFISSTTASRTVSFQVTGTGVQGVSATPNPSLGSTLALQGGGPVAATPQAGASRTEFKSRLRQTERRELTPLRRSGREDAAPLLQPSRSIAPASIPVPGQLLQYNVNSTSACSSPDFRTGRVVAVTDRAVVVADTANPRGAGTYSDQEYVAFAQTFDSSVWPTMVQNFGEPQDIDANQRVVIFFTRAVNELTPRNQEWYVGGFFFARDLFPRTAAPGFEACPASNNAELMYMLVPDPQGVVNGNVRLKERELRSTVAVIAHEFQHLINASRRLYVVRAGGANWNEETWLNEGLSHIAEELMAYATSPLSPRQNIDGDRLAASQAEQTAFFNFQGSNVTRLASYLENPDTASMIGPDGLATRGAAWHFLRYAADRRVGTSSEAALWRGLIDSNTTGIANLRSTFGGEPLDWMRDWMTAVYADDAVPGVESRFTFPSWNFRSVFPRLRSSSGQQIYARYPLKTRTLANGTAQSLSIRAGSAAYLRFGVPAGSSAEVTAESAGGGALDGSVRFTLVRTR